MSYELEIESAQEMIAEAGALVTWRKLARPANVDEPWKTNTAEPQDFPVCIVFASQGDSLTQAIFRLVKGTDAVTGAPRGLMAGGQEFVPEVTDQVIKPNGEVLLIGSIDPVAPDLTPILYKIRFA